MRIDEDRVEIEHRVVNEMETTVALSGPSCPIYLYTVGRGWMEITSNIVLRYEP